MIHAMMSIGCDHFPDYRSACQACQRDRRYVATCPTCKTVMGDSLGVINVPGDGPIGRLWTCCNRACQDVWMERLWPDL